jgi:hypothetical protein
VARKLRIKAGGIILAAMLPVAVLNLMTDLVWLPSFAKTVIQILSGIFIGIQISRKDVKRIGKLALPMILLVTSMIALCVGMGFLVQGISRFNLATSLLSSAPGGVIDMTLIGQDVGADISVVSIIQLFRYSAVVSFFPTVLGGIIRLVLRKKTIQPGRNPELSEPCEKTDPLPLRQKLFRIGLTFAVAAAAGALGFLTRIPAGALLFSMAGCAALNLLTGMGQMPKDVKFATQAAAGALIGTSITLAAVINLRYVILPAAVILVGFFVINLLVAMVLHRFGGLDLMTAVFSSLPGGAQEICLVADDYGAKLSQVSILQIARSMTVIASYAFLVKLFNRISAS